MKTCLMLILPLFLTGLCAPLIAQSPNSSSAKVPPALQLAKLTKEHIQASETALIELDLEMAKTIESALSRYEPGKIEQAVDSLKTFRPYVGQLRKLAVELTGKKEQLVVHVGELKSALEKAPETFRAAGKQFREWAAEETFADTKNDYLTLADSWDAIAELMVLRQKAVIAEEENAKKLGDYVSRTAIFLERFEMFLDTVADFPDSSHRMKYASQLQGYVKGFEELRRLMRKFHDNVKGDSEVRELNEMSEQELEVWRKRRKELITWLQNSNPKGVLSTAAGKDGIPGPSVGTELVPGEDSDSYATVSKTAKLKKHRIYPVTTANGQAYGTVEVFGVGDNVFLIERVSGGSLKRGLVVRETAFEL